MYYQAPRFRPVQGIWISFRELAQLPISGSEFDEVHADAIAAGSDTIDLSDQNDAGTSKLVALTMAGLRLQDAKMLDLARQRIFEAIGSQDGARTLAIGRELPGLVIAAQMLGLHDGTTTEIDALIDACRFGTFDGRTLISTSEQRGNNWMTWALFARLCAAWYRKDIRDFLRCAQVFAGYVGDRSAYAGFRFESPMSWHVDPAHPVGINPTGSVIDGHNVDGVLPDDQRRSGGFTWPPPRENYVWEALQGLYASAVVLERAGFDAFEWGDRALYRAVRWLYDVCGFPAEGDDVHLPHIVRKRYDPTFPVTTSSRHGKALGWSRWTCLAPTWAAQRT